MSIRPILIPLALTVTTSCQQSAPPPAQPPVEQGVGRELENRTEVLHQTREVIRYVDEEEGLRRQEEAARGVRGAE